MTDYIELPSGLVVPESCAPTPMSTCMDLFSGAGGFSLGMIQAGFHVVAAADSDPVCAMTYLHNLGAHPVQFYFAEESDAQAMEKAIQREWKRQDKGVAIQDVFVSGSNRQPDWGPGVEHFFLGDIRKFTGEYILDAIGMERGELDCIVGGPPCQGFTTVNRRRNKMDPRNSLVFEFARLVVEMQPKSMCMENVPGILHMVTPEGLPVMDVMCRILEDGGFGTVDSLKRSLLSSAGCGAALRTGKNRKSKKPQGGAAGVQQDLFSTGR